MDAGVLVSRRQPRRSQLRAQNGAKRFRDSDRVQDEIGVDGDGTGAGDRYDRTEYDEEAKHLVVGVEQVREEEPKDQ
jgi:hypothetical protein